MGFMDSYKRLEKLCGEIMKDDRRISAYIDEMISKPRGSFTVGSWNDDLKKLKHYRWVRNQITHEPGCTEQNMCSVEDTTWIDNFYWRIMHQTDPLSLYRKATLPDTHSRVIQNRNTSTFKPEQAVANKRNQPRSNGCCISFLIAAILIFATVVFIAFVLALSLGLKEAL